MTNENAERTRIMKMQNEHWTNRDDPYWTHRNNSLKPTVLSSIKLRSCGPLTLADLHEYLCRTLLL